MFYSSGYKLCSATADAGLSNMAIELHKLATSWNGITLAWNE